MDCRVTNRASLKLRRLVVELRRPRRGTETRARVALEAKQVQIALLQHVGVGRAVRHMTGLATVRLYSLVLEDERPLLVRMAREADSIPRGR